MHIDLNIFRTIIVTDLQHKSVGRHRQNCLFSTTSAVHYNDIVFKYGECLHATIKDNSRYSICITIKPNNMIHIKFDFFK